MLFSVTKHKFVCQMHSEAKQTETSEFGAEKSLLQGHARRMGDSASKTTELLTVFREKFLQAKFGLRAVECVTFF